MGFPHPSKAFHGLGCAGVGLPLLLRGYVSRPSSWAEFHRHVWTHGGFSLYETSFVKFFLHDGGQMSAPVCRLLRISIWHVNMSSWIKCCRLFHLLQCLRGVSMCVYQITVHQISFIKRKNPEAYVLSFITNARNIMTNKHLKNDGINLDITHCYPDNLSLIAKAK